MSLVEKYLTGWRFRTTTPDIEVDREYQVVITGYDGATDTAVARIGDSVLRVEGADRDHLDTVARVRVTEFDDDAHEGRAELLEVVGETTY